MADNIMTRRTHEAAPAHKAAVEERLREQRLGVSKARREEERAASDMARLDAAAKVAYARTLVCVCVCVCVRNKS